jgi:hypothetical protein
MKIKNFILGLCSAVVILNSCDDTWSPVGVSVQEDNDKITVFLDTFQLEASTVPMEAIYARTDTGLLGEIYDPAYGTLKSDYICQFYCPEEFTFNHTPIDGKIDSVDFRIFYISWTGDSLAPMRAQIFPVNKPLEKNFYTNIHPEDYCDMQNPLGAKVYTPHDLTVPDSLWYAIGSDGYRSFDPRITIPLPKELGQKFYDETIQNPGSFSDQESFNRFFPGFYITTTFGSGNIIGARMSYLTIYYKYIAQGSEGQDTIVNGGESFSTTREVIQLHRFKNTDIDYLLQPNEEFTYLKTPAGVCTRVVIPVPEIAPAVEGHILNNLALNFTAMPQEEYNFALGIPPNLLVLPEDSVQSFFEQGKVEDNITSFVYKYNPSTLTYSSYDVSGGTYSSMNISNLLKYQLENHPDENLVLSVIPVIHQTETNSYYQVSYTTSISNYFSPGGVTLRKDKDVRKLVVISSRYGK